MLSSPPIVFSFDMPKSERERECVCDIYCKKKFAHESHSWWPVVRVRR